MTISEDHLNPMGIAHGGSVSSLADTCIGFGAYAFKPDQSTNIVVTDQNLSFISTGKLGQTLIGNAMQVHGGALTQVNDRFCFERLLANF